MSAFWSAVSLSRQTQCMNTCLLIQIIFLHVHTRLCGCVCRWCSQYDVVLLSTTACLDALTASRFPRRHSIITTLCTQRQVQRQIVQTYHTPVNTYCNDHHLKQGGFCVCFIRMNLSTLLEEITASQQCLSTTYWRSWRWHFWSAERQFILSPSRQLVHGGVTVQIGHAGICLANICSVYNITLSVHSGAGISCQQNMRRCHSSDWTQNYCRKSLKRVICQGRLLVLLWQSLECRSWCRKTLYESVPQCQVHQQVSSHINANFRLSLSGLTALSYRVTDESCLRRNLTELRAVGSAMRQHAEPTASLLEPVRCRSKFVSVSRAVRKRFSPSGQRLAHSGRCHFPPFWCTW